MSLLPHASTDSTESEWPMSYSVAIAENVDQKPNFG